MGHPPFCMSKYVTLQDLLADKSSYYFTLAAVALKRLEELEEIRYEAGEPYWATTGDLLVED